MDELQAKVILERILESKSAEELSSILRKEFGFNTKYLTLEGKDKELQSIREDIDEEQESLSMGRSKTQMTLFSMLGEPKKEYSLDDLYLVRTSDIYSVDDIETVPKDGQVLSHIDFNNGAFKRVERAVGLGKNYSVKEYLEKEEKIKKLKNSITPYLRQYRSTKHYTINTLVSNNSGGNWDRMPYIYLEPMAPHLDDSNLSHIAPHDTFFRGDVKLLNPTLILPKRCLIELIGTKNPKILQSLLSKEVFVIDDDAYEKKAKLWFVAYVLRKFKNAPFYFCNDHGVNISSEKGVYKPLYQFAKEHNIEYGTDHDLTDEKEMDRLHFARNIAEDEYRYLVFIRDNPKFNLSEEKLAVIDKAIDDYHKICQRAGEMGISIDFTEENTPIPTDEVMEDYNQAIKVFHELQSVIVQAIEEVKFFESVNIKILKEETERYNREFKEALETSAEYLRADTFKFGSSLSV